MAIHDTDYDIAKNVACRLTTMIASYGSLRAVARTLSKESELAAMSRIMRGESVSRRKLLKVARLVEVLPPPRKLHRIVVTPEQLQAWRNGEAIRKE